MTLFRSTTPPMARTLRVLARLLGYPEPELRAHLDLLRTELHAERALDAARLAEIDGLIDHLQRQDPLEAEADYVQLFDSGRRTALHLFEHVHGDSRDRGPALIDLAQTYEKAGLYLAEGQMPDHLPVLLEFCSTQPPREARAFLGEVAHLFNVVFNALQQRHSRYASVLGALIELAGETASKVQIEDEPPLDQTWAEPEVFGGCSSQGQARPDQPQPIRITRRSGPAAGATGARA